MISLFFQSGMENNWIRNERILPVPNNKSTFSTNLISSPIIFDQRCIRMFLTINTCRIHFVIRHFYQVPQLSADDSNFYESERTKTNVFSVLRSKIRLYDNHRNFYIHYNFQSACKRVLKSLIITTTVDRNASAQLPSQPCNEQPPPVVIALEQLRAFV